MTEEASGQWDKRVLAANLANLLVVIIGLAACAVVQAPVSPIECVLLVVTSTASAVVLYQRPKRSESWAKLVFCVVLMLAAGGGIYLFGATLAAVLRP